MEKFKVLISEEEIQSRVKELAMTIEVDYKDKQPVVICMLKGAVYFFADLTKHIRLPLLLDFARLSSYRNNTESGEMMLYHDISTDIEGKDVILVEDIVDSGKTLNYFKALLLKKNPASIKICALLDKKERREVDICADYVGFDIPNSFVVGYGLDYAEKYRYFPFIAELLDPEND